MSRYLCLSAILGAISLGISADPAPPRSAENEVTWSDTWPGSDLKSYLTDGGVKLDKTTGIVIGPDQAFICREAQMGFDADFRMEVQFPKGKKRAITLAIGQRWGSIVGVHVRFVDGKTTLVPGLPPETPVTLSVPKGEKVEGPWIVSVNIRHGVMRAKAWQKGDTEPTTPQIVRWFNDPGWEPRFVAIQTDDGDEALLNALSVRGTRPATKQFLQSFEKLLTQPSPTLKVMAESSIAQAEGKPELALKKARESVTTASFREGANDPLTAVCWNNVGVMLNDLRQSKEAMDAFQKAYDIRVKVLAADHPHVGTAFSNLGAGYLGIGQYDEAEKWYRKALALRKKVLGDHPDTAFTLHEIGLVHGYKLKFAEAVEYTREALKMQRAVLGDRHPDTLRMQRSLAYRLMTAGEYPAAHKEYATLLEITRELHDPNHPTTAQAEYDLGSILKALGEYNEALKHLEIALAIYTKAGNAHLPAKADVLNQLGIVTAELGQDRTARKFFDDAIAIRKNEKGPDDPDLAVLYVNLATVLWTLGEHEQAEKVIEEALRILDKLPADDFRIVLAWGTLSALLGSTSAGDKAAALKVTERALKSKQQILGETHPSTIETLINYGTLLLYAQEAERAEKLLREALEGCTQKFGSNHRLTWTVAFNHALALYQLGRLPEAITQVRAAVTGCEKTFGKQHSMTARARIGLATILAAQGKREESLEQAAAATDVFADVLRNVLVGVPESQHNSTIDEWWPRSQVYLRLAAADPQSLGKFAPSLWATVMDWKAASGRATLAKLEAFTIGQNKDAGESYEKLKVNRRSLVADIMRGPPSDDIAGYTKKLEDQRDEIENLERKLAQQVEGFGTLAKARGATSAEIARHLPPRSVLLEFISLTEIATPIKLPKGMDGKPAYLALVVIPKPGGGDPDVKLIPLGLAAILEKTIETWRKDVDSKKRNPVSEEELREQLWDPIANVLPANTQRLFIAPAGQIALIPFEAIWSDNAFLIEKYLISYCSTGRDLIPRPTPAGEPGESVVVADPDFDHVPAGTPVPKGIRPAGPGSDLAFRSEPPKEDSLDGFATEADAVAKLLKAKYPGQSRSFLRVEATEEAVQTIKRPRVLYFVTHGNFLPDPETLVTLEGRPGSPVLAPTPGGPAVIGSSFGNDPRLRSYLCLTGFNKWKERLTLTGPDKKPLSDGILTAREVEMLDLWGTDLVVTAACKTGVGEVHVGEGVLGLRRAFQQAGARSVVTSLWSVADDKTATLLPKFLGYYLEGTDKAAALQKAQLELIRDLRATQKKKLEYQAAPFFWAGFICHGLPDSRK